MSPSPSSPANPKSTAKAGNLKLAMTAESVIDRQSAGRVVVVKLVGVGGADRGDDDCFGG